ncbi:MBL fold metallo-hydrolase [Streptomyces sp. XM4193]|uniref:MBL fold metallo-hydrolase n=1 Tax=Streptomyces sp. XM4193 TaxID=2929782 RepID=UPI001FF9CF80|nr:MBL fold metallo-hydrolase [Streptomyces sp. XM4193]MCK1798439.1 MBL fold metallo-hydrolase [Streptomyces sp. XM4193]
MTPHTGAHLRKLAEGLHVWLPTRRGWGLANCGLVVGNDTALWIDTPYDRRLAGRFLAASGELLPPGVAIDRVVVTHGNGDHFWGAGVVPDAEVIAAKESLEQAEAEPDPRTMHAFVRGAVPEQPSPAPPSHSSPTASPRSASSSPSTARPSTVPPRPEQGAAHAAGALADRRAEELLRSYMRRHFGSFDWADTERVRPTLLFRGELELSVGGRPVRVVGLPPAHTTGDLFVHLPDHGTVFAGDVVFGSTPAQPGDHAVHWAGPLSAVSAVCERILATGAETIVPGHGPVLGRSDVRAHLDYLHHLRERAEEFHARGLPAPEAARRVIAERRHPELGLPERLVVTMRTEYRHLSPAPRTGVLEVMAEVAQLAAECEGTDDPASSPTG